MAKIKKNQKGFTLVEILTVIAIMTLMLAAMLISNSTFGANLLLTNLAYDISSTIREEQSYGFASKNWKTTVLSGALGEGFDVGYGVHFERDNRKFNTFFETSDGVSHKDKDYLISGRSTISKICAIVSVNLRDCYDFNSPGNGINSLDIAFRRIGAGGALSPDAYISTDVSPYPNQYQSAEITLIASTGLTKTIVVTQIGQILVQ